MVSNWRILAIFLPVTVTAFAGTSAFAQMSDEALRAMIVGQTYTMTQPKAAAGTLSAAEQARQQAELGVRYAEATKATAGKSLASPMPRPAFADQVEVLTHHLLKPSQDGFQMNRNLHC